MKKIPESKFKYIGSSGAWHLFVSRHVGSDREILCVQRAKYLLNSGGTKVFPRIKDRKDAFLKENRINLSHIALEQLGIGV